MRKFRNPGVILSRLCALEKNANTSRRGRDKVTLAVSRYLDPPKVSI
jgi:hypothetical protein